MKAHTTTKFILLSLIISLLCTVSYAQDKKISVQGFLKDANGKAIADGSYSITFKLFEVMTGGTAIWENTQPVDVLGGVYSSHLGAGTPSAIENLTWDVPYFLSVWINGAELTPRTELTYAPYSMAVNKAVLANEVICSGAVGDVKWSILNPDQFEQVNGDCWRLYGRTEAEKDGVVSITNTTLADVLGRTTLPDPSGYFIRAAETTNSPDVDTQRGQYGDGSNYETGLHEGDWVKAHSHGYEDMRITEVNNVQPTGVGDGTATFSSSYKSDLHSRLAWNGPGVTGTSTSFSYTPFRIKDINWYHESLKVTRENYNRTTADNVGGETVPKSINLFLYIRVN